MSKEERYTYHCDQYDYIEVIYDNEECEEIDSMKMAEKRLNRQQDKIADLEAKLEEYKQSLKETIDHYEKYCSEINHQNVMLYAAAFNAQQASQDKISLAVEQLEKVKNRIQEDFDYDDLMYWLNKQIAQLTHQHEDKGE